VASYLHGMIVRDTLLTASAVWPGAGDRLLADLLFELGACDLCTPCRGYSLASSVCRCQTEHSQRSRRSTNRNDVQSLRSVVNAQWNNVIQSRNLFGASNRRSAIWLNRLSADETGQDSIEGSLVQRCHNQPATLLTVISG
jgi:hypothetical protein